MSSGISRAPAVTLLVTLLATGSAALAGVTTQPARKSRALPIIELRGDGAQIGRQHGAELRESIRLLQEKYLRPWFRDRARYEQALQTAGQFRQYLQPAHKAEIDALAKAAGLSQGEALLANCFLDISPAMACSTIALPGKAAPDGVGRFGRNLDFASMGVADTTSVLLVVHPNDGYAFAAVSWPGLVGVLSGMNEHGLALANMEVARQREPVRAMPYILLYRTVLEQCKTVDQAIALLGKTPRQSANNLMLMDADGGRAVVEITPTQITVRKGLPDAALISTNHQRGQDQDTVGRCWRYDRLNKESRARFGKIDTSQMMQLLSYVHNPGETLQAMVFEPSTRELYVWTAGQQDNHHWTHVDLKPYFSK